MKKILLMICVASSLAQAMENSFFSALKSSPNEERIVNLKICPKWETVNNAGCENCVALCICCCYLTTASVELAALKIQEKFVQATARRMQ